MPQEAHFVEMDPWVISNVLLPNLRETNCENQAVVHTSKVETLLEQASKRGGKNSILIYHRSILCKKIIKNKKQRHVLGMQVLCRKEKAIRNNAQCIN